MEFFGMLSEAVVEEAMVSPVTYHPWPILYATKEAQEKAIESAKMDSMEVNAVVDRLYRQYSCTHKDKKERGINR
jgi:hypothetical protein